MSSRARAPLRPRCAALTNTKLKCHPSARPLHRRYAAANGKVVIGPATVGGVAAGAFKIGDAAGTLENIVACKLYRPGRVGFVSKSGGWVLLAGGWGLERGVF